MIEKWFSYDPDGDGFEFHETEEGAKARAHKSFSDEQDEAYGGGWGECVTYICWGQVSQWAEETERRKGEPDEEFDEYITYALRPV